jgi:hypothetical protein
VNILENMPAAMRAPLVTAFIAIVVLVSIDLSLGEPMGFGLKMALAIGAVAAALLEGWLAWHGKEKGK